MGGVNNLCMNVASTLLSRLEVTIYIKQGPPVRGALLSVTRINSAGPGVTWVTLSACQTSVSTGYQP